MVRVGSKTSSWRRVISGIPQGSCLGPLLFLIYIKDMGSNISPEEGMVYKFVDDSKLIQGVQNVEDMEVFQDTVDRLYKWQKDNNMKFNVLKFQVVRFGPNQELKDSTAVKAPDGTSIEAASSVRDLGIIVDDQMNFKEQRTKAVAKTTAKSAWVLRMFRSRSKFVMVQLWKMLIQPHLDQCGQLWSPVGIKGMLKA